MNDTTKTNTIKSLVTKESRPIIDPFQNPNQLLDPLREKNGKHVKEYLQ